MPVGGKEEKILIYNQKELNKPMGILYASLAFYEDDNDCRAVPLPQGEGQGESDRTGGNMRQPGLQIRN
ncbi:hypothetical protein CKF46_17180 [Klebsiella pneumoniae]|nr:hypothetical protein CKF46_17180 [Klebsiella pneumoniae]